MELYQANQLTDETQKGRRAGHATNLQMKSRELSRKIVQEVVKKLKNYEEFAVQKLREPDN